MSWLSDSSLVHAEGVPLDDYDSMQLFLALTGVGGGGNMIVTVYTGVLHGEWRPIVMLGSSSHVSVLISHCDGSLSQDTSHLLHQ